jgi:hypothetical protein
MRDKILPLLSMVFFFIGIVYSILSPYLAPTINSNLHQYIFIAGAIGLLSLGTILKMIMNLSKERQLGVNSEGVSTEKRGMKDILFLIGRVILYFIVIALSVIMVVYSTKYYKSALHNVGDHNYLNYLNNWIYIFLTLIYVILGLKFWKKVLRSKMLMKIGAGEDGKGGFDLTSINWSNHLRVCIIWTLFMVILFSFELTKFSDDNNSEFVNDIFEDIDNVSGQDL